MASTSLLHYTSLVLLLLFAFFALETNSRTLEDASMRERHEQWMAELGKIYKDSNEKELRYKIFKENVERIEAFNNAGNKSYKLGINSFTDLKDEEFKARNRFKGYMCSNLTKAPTFKYEHVTAEDTSVDWREKGAVTDVKNQLQCGACWAFSAVAAIEGVTQLSTGKLTRLSEQELVDCDNRENKGCDGGLMDHAFKFVIENQGLTSETNYPYQGVDGTCKEADNVASITGYEDVPANSESALLKAVSNQPVSVGIEASGFEFKQYSSGVFTGSCGTRLDHGVTVVGYGEESDGTKYWLVKNSWGKEWGEEGYIKMQRDIDANEGLCGIAMQASYPTIA